MLFLNGSSEFPLHFHWCPSFVCGLLRRFIWVAFCRKLLSASHGSSHSTGASIQQLHHPIWILPWFPCKNNQQFEDSTDASDRPGRVGMAEDEGFSGKFIIYTGQPQSYLQYWWRVLQLDLYMMKNKLLKLFIATQPQYQRCHEETSKWPIAVQSKMN